MVGEGSTNIGPGGVDARPFAGIDNGFLATYRVRFDEAGPDGRLRVSTLLRYAQDIAWRHSEHLGFDRDWYSARGLGWVVRGVELELHEPVRLGQALGVSTAVVGHRRIWARRLGVCSLSDRVAARVVTDWVLLDARGRIVRIPEAFGLAFTNPEIATEIVRVSAPDPAATPVVRLELDVRRRDLDPLDHVNNAVYLDWLDEALHVAWGEAADRLPRTARLEYLASAGPGERVVVRLGGEPASWWAAIEAEDGRPLLRACGRHGAATGCDEVESQP